MSILELVKDSISKIVDIIQNVIKTVREIVGL